MNPVTSNTLLTYSLNTLPDPLQASPTDGNIVYGMLSFVVSNSGTTVVNLSQLQFNLSTPGTLAQQLTTNPEAILWATNPSDVWNITMTSPGVFLFISQSGSPIPVSTDGMVIQFYNIPVNQQPGTVAINVNETASNTSNPTQVRTATFAVAKFPYGFYFADFTSQVPMVQAGNTVTLTWQGSDNATYSMQWSEAVSVNVTDVRAWVSPALANDTTFVLQASVVSQGETVTTYLSTTVIVANPELQAGSLQVSGFSNLLGATTIGTADAQATVNGNLAINGTVSAIKGAQVIGQGTYTAQTDGFIVLYINSGGAPGGNLCEGYIIITMPYNTFWLNGGNYTAPGSYNINGGSAMTLPLQQGQSCSIRYQNYSLNQSNPIYYVAFFPLGNIPQNQDMFVKVSNDVPEYELPEQSSSLDERAESIAGAILQAVKSDDKGKLTEAVKNLLAHR
jgi:hypothetical protein